ncbi:hypothetical protein A5865_001243, partial [Enterococcus sp. 12E11_DIV0728]
IITNYWHLNVFRSTQERSRPI